MPPLDVVAGPSLAEKLPSDRPVRWGVLATGKIANAFASNLLELPEAELAAVGARRLESAQDFAGRYAAASAYGSYQEVVDDPAVDVVYVATPHALHKEHVLMAFEAGKPVLCEKSLALNAAEAAEMVAAARENRLFLMEAMWMRCNPVIRRLQQLLATGDLGQVRQVRADLGFVVDKPTTDRLLDPALGGGVLLDMGVYPLTFAHLFLGAPSQVAAVAQLSPEGADLNLAVSLGYDTGAVASLTSSMTSWTPRTASIGTEKGRFDLPDGFHHPTSATWTSGDDPGVTDEIHDVVIGTGLANEALEVIRCLRNGETESPMVPLDDTVALMAQMDRIRSEIGVVYEVD